MKRLVVCLCLVTVTLVFASAVLAESASMPRSVSGGSALADRTAAANSKDRAASEAQSEVRARPGDISDIQAEPKRKATKVRRGNSGGSAMVDTATVGSTK